MHDSCYSSTYGGLPDRDTLHKAGGTSNAENMTAERNEARIGRERPQSLAAEIVPDDWLFVKRMSA